MRADKLRLTAMGVFPIVIDFDAMFTADKEMEDRVEQEILGRFGGYDAMVKTFEAEITGQPSMTAAEAIAHLRSLTTKD